MSGKLEQRIQSAHLTRTEKVIADYFLEHSGSLYFLTAKDIALALSVSDTSVIRLCRTLGYRGFRELQESLRSELSQVIEREKYVIPQHQVPDKLQKYQDLSSFQCLQFAVDCLQETYRKNDPEKYGQIVPNVGMFASFDPVALDTACADMINAQTVNPNSVIAHEHDHPHDHFTAAHPDTDWRAAVEHGEAIGLGTTHYELIEV